MDFRITYYLSVALAKYVMNLYHRTSRYYTLCKMDRRGPIEIIKFESYSFDI